MTVYSAFAPSTLGMLSQSYALNVIGNNVANVNTSGFKGTDTRFSTVLSHSLFQQSDLGGAVPNDLHRINIQGSVIGTDSEQNLAINGQGFFILERTFGSGNYYYGRAGDFQMRTVNDITVENNGETITTKDGYLVDKNGYFVMGYVPDVDGTFPHFGRHAPGIAGRRLCLHRQLPADGECQHGPERSRRRRRGNPIRLHLSGLRFERRPAGGEDHLHQERNPEHLDHDRNDHPGRGGPGRHGQHRRLPSRPATSTRSRSTAISLPTPSPGPRPISRSCATT